MGGSKTLKNSLVIMFTSILVRLFVWFMIPVDWNWDSFHHWQISFLSLKIGFPKGRFWDLNGCEYYWGIIPHFCHAVLLSIFGSSILSIRVFNLVLGSVNAVIIYLIIEKNFSSKMALFLGLSAGFFPIASIFDILALQDTIAVTLVLSSIYCYSSHPFYSGILLALSGQSRTEFLLVGSFIVLIFFLVEGLSTERLPFLIGWVLITFLFGCFLYNQTGNPFYHLYWSLYNVFGGWEAGNQGKPLMELMFNWVVWKLKVWPTKLTGIFLLSSMASLVVSTLYFVRKKVEDYQFFTYFLSTLVVLSPSFITYLWSNHEYLMIMLRMLNPIFFLFLLLIPYLLRFDCIVILRDRLLDFKFPYLMLIIILLSNVFIVPYYSGFQAVTISAFKSADHAFPYYNGGKIVCDYPTINYRLVKRWGISSEDLLGNHYSPHYYGILNPLEYARWFDENEIKLWLYYDSRALPVWNVVSHNYPSLLIHIMDLPSARLYAVNQTILDDILTRGR